MEQKTRVRAMTISLIFGVCIFSLKALAYFLTNSKALESDAIESIANMIAAAFGLGAVIYAGRRADKDHPYGHGKIEYFAATFEGGLVSLASVVIIYEAVAAMIHGAAIQSLSAGLILNISAGAINGLLGWYLIHTGKKFSSKTIEADGYHVLSDFYTTAGVLLGLFTVKLTGLLWLDPVIAVAVGLFLARTGYKLVRESAAALLDQEDAPTIERIVNAINAMQENALKDLDIIALHGLRAIRAGRHIHIDIHLVVPEHAAVAVAHGHADRFEEALIEACGLDGELHAHIDPCQRRYCGRCADNRCQIRTHPFRQKLPLALEARAAEIKF